MNKIGVGAQAELGHEEPEVVLAGDEVRRGRHMDHHVDLLGVQPRVDEGGAAGSERQVTIIESALGPAPLAPSAELVVQPPFIDAKVLDDPLGLEGPTVGASGMEVFEDLLVGDSAIRQVGADTDQGNGDFGRKPWNRGTSHRTISLFSNIGISADWGTCQFNDFPHGSNRGERPNRGDFLDSKACLRSSWTRNGQYPHDPALDVCKMSPISGSGCVATIEAGAG